VSQADDISLDEIQKLQFSDKGRAEELAKSWLNTTFDLNVDSVELRPSAVSLNSFNGVATLADRSQVFFKSHTEPGSIITEYYNSEIMEKGGYNILQPLLREGRFGAQIALYPVIETPNLFEVTRQLEQSGLDYQHVLDAERNECSRLLEIYRDTAEQTSAEDNTNAPIYQLFWHRLTGGRLTDYYEGSSFFTQLDTPWVINGVEQERTLRQLIDEAIEVLDPRQQNLTAIGHGDAHFGNVFLDENNAFMYFDPAFAGRHSPLLDIVKPLVHNTILQPWLYYPDTPIDVNVVVPSHGPITVDYPAYGSPLRSDLWRIKQDELVAPLLQWFESEGALPYGRRVLDLASMCCPLLTMNLSDTTRFPPNIGWLGLAIALQLGNGDSDQDFRLASS
jgi:hypothetical protein